MNYPLMYNNITREDTNEIIKFLSQETIPQLTNGPKIREFESKWSEWLGVKYSLMVNSGASANELTLLYLKHKYPEGGEIIVPPLCWVSDIAAILQNGFTPVFCDINYNNLALNVDEVKSKITNKTKAVLLIHILGYNGINDDIINLCKDNNVLLIEDTCESHGATYKGKKVGSLSDVSNFSFYYAHHMTCIEGGIISTDNEEMYQLLRTFRSHGMLRESTNNDFKQKVLKENPSLNKDFVFVEAAHNFRSTEINAVIALNQIKRLDENNKIRSRNLNVFLDNLNKDLYYTEFDREGNSNYAFTLLLRNKNFELRDKVEKHMVDNQIEFRRGMSGGGNQLRQPYLKKYFNEDECTKYPVTEHIHHFGWYIGNYPELSTDRILELVSILNKC